MTINIEKNVMLRSTVGVLAVTKAGDVQPAFNNAMQMSGGSAKQLKVIYNYEIKKPNFSGEKFAFSMATCFAKYAAEYRQFMVAQLGCLDTWKAYGDDQLAYRSSMNTLNAWLGRNVGWRADFNDSRQKPADFLGGAKPIPEFKLVEQKAKAGKTETAAGKNSKSAEVKTAVPAGASESSREVTAADILAAIGDNAKLQRSVILNLLNQHPELTLDKAVKDNFQRNYGKASKSAAQARKLGKAKAA